ncbi:MAG: hypothetical protein WBH20_09360 [Oceanisphaera sp.]|uniref:hypothetical protein n=1 Tax=Oceanisphaera sp. TaxID=1929979 RepID=UPI003C77E0F7
MSLSISDIRAIKGTASAKSKNFSTGEEKRKWLRDLAGVPAPAQKKKAESVQQEIAAAKPASKPVSASKGYYMQGSKYVYLLNDGITEAVSSKKLTPLALSLLNKYGKVA